MRNTILALVLAAGALGAATVSSQAGGYGYGHGGYGYGYGYQQTYSYGYEPSYSYEPVCFYKTRTVYDDYGYAHYQRFKVCN
jgi:hypothetical protein